jgi:hypothetical protein
MAKLYAYVPADKAVAINLRVDKIVRLVKTPQNDRALDQRRADVVCDLLLGRPSNVQVQLQVTVPTSMLMRLDDQPGELAGYGPITADVDRRAERAVGGRPDHLPTDRRTTGLRAGAGQDLRVPRLLHVGASGGPRPHDSVPGSPDGTGESVSDVPSAPPPQAGPPVGGVPAESGKFRMDDPEGADLRPRAGRGLMR